MKAALEETYLRATLLLRELKAQRDLLDQEERGITEALTRLNGKREMLRVLEARLRGGMIDGFDRLGMEESS